MSDGGAREPDGASALDLAALRAKLAGQTGPKFWKSLDAIADTAEFRRLIAREYPAAAALSAGPDRRRFFQLMAASFAMSGLAACTPVEDGRKVEAPYVRQPERIEAGKPLTYASATLVDGFANGVLVSTVDGRPIKIAGNSRHPWSLGGTDIFGQASVLGLYDPSRSQTVRLLNRISDWDTFRNRMLGRVASLKADGGQGLRFLTGQITSPATIALLTSILSALPKAKWHMMSAADATDTASREVFGTRVQVRPHFDRARVVVALDGDFLDFGPAQVGLSRRFFDARQARARHGELLALHAATSTPSLTSAKADFHLSADPDVMAGLPARLAAAVANASSETGNDAVALWVSRAAAALRDAKGEALVLAGPTSPAATIAAVHRLNATLGHNGKTVSFSDPVLPDAEPLASLVAAMNAGQVDTLMMLDCDPVHDAPGSLQFNGALDKVNLKIHAGDYVDATAIRADWHLPLSHPLESWGDARSVDGTASLIQPTVRPLYEGRSGAEILSLVFEDRARDGETILRDFWRGKLDPAAFEAKWRQALLDGFWEGSTAPDKPVEVKPATATSGGPLDLRQDDFDLVFRPDSRVRSVAQAANVWLQELPDPLTKITWNNAALISPVAAERLKLANGDIVALSTEVGSVEAAVWIMPGQAERTLTVTLGYGRSAPDMVFDGLGYDANRLRSDTTPWLAKNAKLAKTGRRATLATTQDLSTMEGHDFIKRRPVDAAQPIKSQPERSLYGRAANFAVPHEADGSTDSRAWGMVIDLDSCTGCSACVVSCQAENNIAVVGAEQVARGRNMHWLRVDRYFSSAKSDGNGKAANGLDSPDMHFQPVPCMHCELAPCEVGCPVEATLHDHEGLNVMVYNRCVGTRACSGYCPYKVRRFNYLDYTAGESPTVQLRNNPDVSVRARGVMEKCTYCVQRIVQARIESDKSGQPIKDGSVTTACQDACPTRAISFGDLADTSSLVAAKRQDPRNYSLLDELNVRPRTTYLAERAPAAPTSPHGREG